MHVNDRNPVMTGIQGSRNPELPSREGSCSNCGHWGDAVLPVQIFAGFICVVKVEKVLVQASTWYSTLLSSC